MAILDAMFNPPAAEHRGPGIARTPALATVTAPNGTRFQVAAEHAPRWQAFLNDPQWAHFQPQQDQSGGHNNRNILGTAIPSQHAYGNAIDMNWRDNPRNDQRTTDDPTRQFNVMDPVAARALSSRYGMTWGGDWSNPDPMHFEVGRNPPPVPATTQPLLAGAPSPAPSPTPVAAPNPSVAPPGGPPDAIAPPTAEPPPSPANMFGLNMPPNQQQRPPSGSDLAMAEVAKMVNEPEAASQSPRVPRQPIDLSRIRAMISRTRGMA